MICVVMLLSEQTAVSDMVPMAFIKANLIFDHVAHSTRRLRLTVQGYDEYFCIAGCGRLRDTWNPPKGLSVLKNAVYPSSCHQRLGFVSVFLFP
jgi:hypothetical protein